MSHTALYRAFIAAGTEEKLAKEAAESVMYAREAATRIDLAEFKAEIEVKIERSMRELTWRFIGYVFAMLMLFFTFDKLVLGG